MKPSKIERGQAPSFEREIKDLTDSRLKLTVFIGVIGFSLFAVLDRIIDPVLFEKLVWIRGLTVLGFGLVYLASLKDQENRWAETLGIVTFMFSAASIEVMVLNTGGHQSDYYAGLNLVLLGTVVLMPWHWTRTMLVAAGTILIYNLGILLTESISDTVTFATNNFFVFFTGVIGVAGSAAAFIVRKNEYESRKRLRDLAAFRQNILANLSHEMRTPLTLLLGAVNRLLRNSRQDADELELLRESRQSGLELLKLINDLLEMSRIDAAMEYVTAVMISSNELMSSMEQMAKVYASRNGVNIDVAVKTDYTFVGDRAKLQRVFSNLMSNALKFTPRGGTISLRCIAEPDFLLFTVKDSGPGIPKEKREMVFERFRQVDTSATRRHGGTGIGLSMVRDHVQMHGGEVWIEGPEEGGTEVKIRLPRKIEGIPKERLDRRSGKGAQNASTRRKTDRGVSAWTQVIVEDPAYQAVELASATERRKGVRSSRNEGAPRVLICDDTPEILRLLSYQLCGEYDLVLARNGMEAMELTKKWRPQLVVTDMMMPGMTGAELCAKLRDDPEITNIPVVLLTANTGDEARIEAREAGAVAYLTKPCEESELLATVSAILKQREQSAQSAAKYETERTAYVAEGIAHEIRNPLGFVMNSQFLMADVARQALELAESHIEPVMKSQLEEVLSQAEASGSQGIARINKMVDQVASLSEQETDHGECDPKIVGEEVGCLVRPKLGERTLSIDIPSTEVKIAGGLLHDVLLNLVKNALDAIGDNAGAITITGTEREKHLEILVSDNGPGIPEHIRGQIFQPFFTTKAPGEGTGLGLAVSKQKMVQASGDLYLKEGQGNTTFVLKLPYVREDSSPQAA